MNNWFSSYCIPYIFNTQYIGTIKDKDEKNAFVVSTTILKGFTHIIPSSLKIYYITLWGMYNVYRVSRGSEKLKDFHRVNNARPRNWIQACLFPNLTDFTISYICHTLVVLATCFLEVPWLSIMGQFSKILSFHFNNNLKVYIYILPFMNTKQLRGSNHPKIKNILIENNLSC